MKQKNLLVIMLVLYMLLCLVGCGEGQKIVVLSQKEGAENRKEQAEELDKEAYAPKKRDTSQLEEELALVNAYRKAMNHYELNMDDVEGMCEYPIYPNGKSRWDRVVDYVTGRKREDNSFSIPKYDKVPSDNKGQLEMVNAYYGMFGGGFGEYVEEDGEGIPHWIVADADLDYILSYMNSTKKERIVFDSIPENLEEQIALVQACYMQIPYPPLTKDADSLYQNDVTSYMEMPGYEEGTSVWDEMVQYAFDEIKGNGPKMKEYTEIPQDLDEQLYMVNACYKLIGEKPLMKGEIFRDFEYADDKHDSKDVEREPWEATEFTPWEEIVECAFEISNGKRIKYEVVHDGIKGYGLSVDGGDYLNGNVYFSYTWGEYANQAYDELHDTPH